MSIVHIITRLIVGGAQENTLLSCEGQHDLGHDVTLMTGPETGPEGSLMERASSYGYRVEVVDSMRRAIGPVTDVKCYFRLVKRLRELRPDVVHTHSSKAGIIGRWAGHRARVPAVIHTIHGLAFTASTSPYVNWVYKMAEKATAPVTTRIVCVADAMARQSLAGGVGRPKQYVTVYSGMETAEYVKRGSDPLFRQTMREELGLRDEHIAVGTIARLFYMKGHDDLLAIAPQMCRKFLNLRWLWIGDGILRQQFERQIAEMGLTDRFILTGLVPPSRIPNLTAAMDVLVHPSRREGLARALPQGQLAGCPVVTYDVDGNREGLIDGQTGFIIPPFDRETLAEKLSLLISDADLRRRTGQAGRQFALSRFDAKGMVDALEAVYKDALGQETRTDN